MKYMLHNLAQIINQNDIDVPRNTVGSDRITVIMQLFFGVAGAVALLVIVFGGLKYVLSRGNPDAITKAKDTIIYAVVGLVVALSAFAIVTFVVDNL